MFGSGKYANRIMAANPGVNAKRLKIGQELNLPDINATSAAETSTLASADRDHTDAVTASPAGKTYKVQAGDSLEQHLPQALRQERHVEEALRRQQEQDRLRPHPPPRRHGPQTAG